MHASSLLSIYQGGQALASLGRGADRRYRPLKEHELATMRAFCDAMKAEGCGPAAFDHFFAGYAIDRISKEFDLLRFGRESVLNIELKAPLRRRDKEEKILRQMRANHHYLSFLGKPLHLFTFVDKDGFYAYDAGHHALRRSSAAEVAHILTTQQPDPSADPDKLFVPANYLLSPFNDTARFLNGEYFLTTSQQSIKDALLRAHVRHPGTCFLLSAPAGTGKTLLLFDLIRCSRANTALFHAGALSPAYQQFRATTHYPIYAFSDIHPATLCSRYALLLIDEAQQLSESHLHTLVAAAQASHTTLLLAYDTAPEIGLNPAARAENLLKSQHPALPLSTQALSTKIRINSALAAFIANLLHRGAKPHHPVYDCIDLLYLYEPDDLRATVLYLTGQGRTLLTSPAVGPGIPLPQTPAAPSGSDVDHALLILDRRFFYDPSGLLQTTDPESQALRDLYRLLSRATDRLTLLIYNNPALYLQLLKILDAPNLQR